MDINNLYLLTFTILLSVVGVIVYNIDINKIEKRHKYE